MGDMGLVSSSGVGGALEGEPSRNPAAVYVARLAPGSRRAMVGALELAARIIGRGEQATAGALPWRLVRYEHVAALRAELGASVAPAYANKILAAVRGVVKEAWRLGLVTAEHYQRVADVENVPQTTIEHGRALSETEIARLLNFCDDGTLRGYRDKAVLTVLYAGLRRAELCALELKDWNERNGAIFVSAGKGSKQRQTYCVPQYRLAVNLWIARRGYGAGPLFIRLSDDNLLPGGRYGMRRLSGNAVREIVVGRAAAAGLGDVSPHDLRRSIVTTLLDMGADLLAVQKLVGHASPQTTAFYDRRAERGKLEAMSRVGQTPTR